PGSVLLDDGLAGRALALQRLDASPGGLQLGAQRVDLAGGGGGQLPVELVLAGPELLDPLLEGPALGLGAGPLHADPLLEDAAVLVRQVDGPAQAGDLVLHLPRLAPAPAEEAHSPHEEQDQGPAKGGAGPEHQPDGAQLGDAPPERRRGRGPALDALAAEAQA